ncbi:TPA: response regulator transcription factor [Streptococcus pyogenes]|uniref:response regulator transcription factor n=1 Tax=Streptococcus pyogenes TaxID=1314 RepID=UPI0003C7C3DD|nr:response regulator transcription factor [Streptococcus pyogenes]HER4777962.1 response regulator transcription factor [Streptococcus pyogenes NGAS169]ESU92775.1 response regulator receiver domain protein [Streptococcus pyogenes GA19702]SQF09052.1 response regulator protein [Streptococcus pyogenes]VHF02251.1 response regulator protein [Streptococcus pyogenes]VHI80249.1 response regulator protein [Streptococcus pyogenes]
MNFESQLLNKRILIVDDDVALSKSIKEVLISRDFKNISCAYSISEGIDIFSVSKIDLIILDVMLPDGEGHLLAKCIRKYSDVPILFLTAKNNPDDEIRGLESGGDDYVTKPFLPKSLTYRIIALLRRAYKDESELIELTNCTIDLNNASVEKNGQHLSLTPTEIQILRKLFSNKNYIASTESICDTVWGLESLGYEKSLMVHIRNIREKIEITPSKPNHLITVKGLGYKLVI